MIERLALLATMERWTSGTGQELMVHNENTCRGQFCPIHKPSDHHMKDWPLHFRDDRGIMERICKCGVGHPDPDDLAFRLKKGSTDTGIHGCCGCCMPGVTVILKDKKPTMDEKGTVDCKGLSII